jgi:YVTN family beta-propeller protein
MPMLTAATIWLGAPPGLASDGFLNASILIEPATPASLLAGADGKTLFIGCAAAKKVALFDLETSEVASAIPVPNPPLGLALSKDGGRLFVTCAAPESTVAVIDTTKHRVIKNIPAGHTALAPVLSPDGKTLYVCNRFNNEVTFIDLGSGKTFKRVPVLREPVAAALTPDGRFLFVGNHLHAGRSDVDVVAASVSVIDTAAGKVVKHIALPNGSGLLRGVAISADGKYAASVHLLSRFHLPTTQIERGWINNNALTLIDVATLKPINTVLLDNLDRGAANPWAVAWSGDGARLIVTHAGTHELSVIDAPALIAKLARMPESLAAGAKIDYTLASRVAADVPNDLSFLVGIRTRVKLPEFDRGPRALALIGNTAFIANYFSDTLSMVDLGSQSACAAKSISLNPKGEVNLVRKGEFYFNDASICFQGWQSCASCHSSDGRVDGLNWDNLNDGIGNPKNVKSLLFAHDTPPSMWLGVRSNAQVAVRAGIKNSLFTVQPPEVAIAIDNYLKSLKPIPSPQLVNGKLSAAAMRGQELFFSETIGCADCHKGKFYTDQKFHDVGSQSRFDQRLEKFDTPSLVEAWRTAPYLHDGSAATVRDVLTTRDPEVRHGNVSGLTKEQLDDLVSYVLSL